MSSDGEHFEGDAPNGSDKIQTKRTFVRSALSFPYVNLEDVVELVYAMHEAGGIPLLREQVAHSMNTTADHGTFNLKISSARLFDLVSFQDNKFQLTELGYGIISSDEDIQKVARRDAFLRVELYRRAVEHFRGKALPSTKTGLEAALVGFGISEKQKDRARLAFEKSAIYAGFMDSSKSRLVEPVIGPRLTKAREILNKIEEVSETPVFTPKRNNQVDVPALAEPLIHGMLSRLPEPGESWSFEDRKKWLDALLVIFSIVYQE